MDAMRAVLRASFISASACVSNLGDLILVSSQHTSNHYNNKRRITQKRHRRQEIIKLRAAINKVGTNTMKQ